MAALLVVSLVLNFIQSLEGIKYQLLLEDPDIFRDCGTESRDVLGISSLFNLSQLDRVMDKDIVTVSGKVSISLSGWQISPTDRIEAYINTYHWEIGVWQPALFSLVYKDFCKVMYEPKQYWYIYWTQYITNADEVKDKCVNVPGTTFYIQPYNANFMFDSVGSKLSGRYKIEFLFKAFDELNRERPTSVCFMSTGEFVKKT